ncbi:MAG: lipopolysaccharide heptosyltransferase II [Bacteroidota bacterium]
MRDTYTKTLIVRFSSVGDVVLSSLLVRVFRRRFPHAQIDYLVKAEFAGLVRVNPNISRVIELPAGATFSDLRNIRKRILASGYDLIVDIHDSLRSRYVSLGARRVVRIRKRKLARFLLVRLKWNVYASFGGAPGVAERYLEPVRPLGVTNDGEGLEVFLEDRDHEKAETILRVSKVSPEAAIIGIAPSARHANKQWPGERFAETALTLLRDPKATCILLGSAEERERCTAIMQRVISAAPDARIINVAGSLSLTEAAALMDRCSLVISNDSGLMHIAAARKRKVVALFGPTVRQFGFFPYGTDSIVLERNGLACRPCTHIGRSSCPKRHFRCLEDIEPDHVVKSVEQFLRQ